MQPKTESAPPAEPSNVIPIPPSSGNGQPTRFSAPENFINRELSWLEFNRRVLEEAQDPTQPLIERVKFLTIFSSNLDEFFEIRVAGIKQQIESETSDVGPDGLSPTETFNAIQRIVREMVATQYALWNDEISPALEKNSIRIHDVADLERETRDLGSALFPRGSFPDAHAARRRCEPSLPPAPQQEPQSAGAGAERKGGELLHAIVQVPRVLPRLILMPRGEGRRRAWDYIYLASLIKHHIAELFPGLILTASTLSASRGTAISISTRRKPRISSAASNRNCGVRAAAMPCGWKWKPIARKISAICSSSFSSSGEMDLYKVDGPLSMPHLAPLVANDAFAKFKDRVFQPARDPALPPHADIFEVMRRQDVFLHHPYESYDPVVEFIESAAAGPAGARDQDHTLSHERRFARSSRRSCTRPAPANR